MPQLRDYLSLRPTRMATRDFRHYAGGMSRVRLLGVWIDALTAREAVARLQGMLTEKAQHHVMTPNAEMLVTASKDAAFRGLLNATPLTLPDSAGLLWAARLTGQHLPERVTGVDTVQALCAALTPEHPVFLLGGAPGVAEKAGLVLRSRNPHLRIAGTLSGSPRDEDADEIVKRVNEAKPHVLLVAYGAPAQDRWIAAHLSQLPSLRIAMGVGGTLDFLAGVQKRAPLIFQRVHLEWLWRVIREPWRWRRIVNAVVVFPILVLRYGKEARK
jgi:N-acetylglucosaminyldiphosphoundecaprenol N-acetyl-beta-D-mannosaminyltransferase